MKLTGLFGLNDLYALVALPATTGLKSADKKQLEQMLVPVAKTWLDNNLTTVQELFSREITGAILRIAEKTRDEVEKEIRLIKADIEACRDNLGR